MKSYGCDGIILARRNIGEADKLISIFTREFGKRTVIARGIRKITSKRAPYLELFSHVRLMMHKGRTFDIVTEVNSIHSFINLRKKLERVGYCYIALELTQRLTAENQESMRIFDNLLDFISLLDGKFTTRIAAKTRLTAFKQFLLMELGFTGKIDFRDEILDENIEEILESRLKSPLLLTNIHSSL